MRVEQYFLAPVSNVVGGSIKPNCTDATHEAWVAQNSCDREFQRVTGISAVGRERQLLQQLQLLGARTDHIRTLWQHGLLSCDQNQLKIMRPAGTTFLASAFYLLAVLVSLPLALQSHLFRDDLLAASIYFLSFVVSIGGAAWFCRSLTQPRKIAELLIPLVAQLNQNLLLERSRQHERQDPEIAGKAS